MIELDIPGRGPLRIEHLVSDVNGTLSVDGQLIDGLTKRIGELRDRMTVHLLTADTYGRQDMIDEQLGLVAVRVRAGDEAAQKEAYVRNLGAENVVALGQGANDAKMLEVARLGICVLSKEGTATETLQSADLLMPDIFSVLDLFNKPLRMIASLRR